ncbi:MAG: hypothetical protein JF595_07210 [Sphingomonadales bacterium]|nr:hypothetical protein [Sphingomonadales bacterium]
MAVVRPGLAAPATSENVTVVTGRLAIEHELVVRGTLTVAPDAGIDMSPGAILRVLGDVVAPATQIFFGPGLVDLTASRAASVRPEWWGAIPNDAATDSEPALARALQAHIAVQLGAGDYFLARPLRIALANRRLTGVGRAKQAHGTRLVLQSDRGAVIELGSERAPPTINDYVRGVELSHLELGRDRPPRVAGDGQDIATGLRVRHVLDANCEGLRASEHSVGFDVRGAVRSYLRDCVAFRSVPAADRAADRFIAFFLDGRKPPIATGANASLYLIDCNASLGGEPSLRESVGCEMLGAMSDTFLVRFETASLDTGIALDGQAGQLPKVQLRNAQIDLHIDTPVLDQCRVAGVVIAGMGADTMIDIRGPYVGVGSGKAVALSIARSGGAISVVGGQFVAPAAFRQATGISLDSASGVDVVSAKLLGLGQPAVLRNSRSSRIDIAVGTAGEDWPEPAIRLAASHLIHVACRLFGESGRYAAAVDLDAASNEITIETSGIDTARIAGPAIRSPGRTGTRSGSSYWFGPSV